MYVEKKEGRRMGGGQTWWKKEEKSLPGSQGDLGGEWALCVLFLNISSVCVVTAPQLSPTTLSCLPCHTAFAACL